MKNIAIASVLLLLIQVFPTSIAFATGFALKETFNDPTPAPVDLFGASVAIDGDHILIGSSQDDTNGPEVGQAHLFDAITGNLLRTFNDPTVTSGDSFGGGLAIDGNHVLIGALFDDTNGGNVGQAHLFDAMTGSLLHTFDDPDISGGDIFGVVVAVDGNHVLIGSNSVGNNPGQAHLFDAVSGNLLHTFDDPNATAGGRFGGAVAVDGNLILIGAGQDNTSGPGVGQAHLYDATTGNLLHTFNDPTVTDGDFFGVSVAIEGNSVLIGANADRTNGPGIGQAHLFDASSGNLLHTFNDPTITNADRFGGSVDISGNLVLIGANQDDTNGENVGQAHLFDATTGSRLQTFNDPTVTNLDFFGSAVAIDGNSILIGAPGDALNGGQSGQAYLFTIVPEPNTGLLLSVLGLLASTQRFRIRRRC